MLKNILILFLIVNLNAYGQKAGDLVNNFGNGGKTTIQFDNNPSNSLRSMLIRNDGKILLLGIRDFTTASDFALVQLNKNGSIDSAFGSNGVVSNFFPGLYPEHKPMLLLKNGQILVGGNDRLNGKSCLSTIRFTENGLLDTTFCDKGKLRYSITLDGETLHAMALQNDDKVLIVGYSRSNFNNSIILARFHPNGEFDSSFIKNGILSKPNGIKYFIPRKIFLDNLGDIYIAGLANDTLYNGNGKFSVIKIKANGNLDSSYGNGGIAISDFGFGTYNYVYSAALQTDGSMVVVGTTSFNDKSSIAIAKYNPKGFKDSSFNLNVIHAIAYSYACDVAIQGDNKILIAGITAGDVLLVRLKPNGSLDSSFGNNAMVVTDINNSDLTKAVAIQPGGNIIVALSAYYDFAVISYYSESKTNVQFLNSSKSTLNIYPNPSNTRIQVSDFENGSYEIFDAYGSCVLKGNYIQDIDITSLPRGLYSIQLSKSNTIETMKFIKS